jgi:aspartate/methionine/tyrosine aminotransferase
MITNRAESVKSFMAMDILARAQELEKSGGKVIHLEVGEPDFDTPLVAQEAAIEAIRSGKTHYTHAMGMMELREAICEHYLKEYGVNISPDRILVTSGTSPALLMIMMAMVEKGEEVILSNPRYACYSNFVEAAGGRVVDVLTHPEDGFLYRADDISRALTPRTRGIFINSPSNPTGIVMSEQNLKDVARFDGQYIISDEIYHGLVYEGRAHSILEYTDRAFVINGFSKLYAMTGWRLGYVIFPREFAGAMERIHQSFMISANSFVQVAGIAALTKAGADVERMKRLYDERRRYMLSRFEAMSLPVHVKPTGAFYVFADARDFCRDSYAEAFSILEKTHVGVTPGIDFGSGGEGFLRFSYANSIENIKEGMNRIEAYLKERRRG